MRQTIASIDRALKALYNLHCKLQAEDFLLPSDSVPGGLSGQGALLIEPPRHAEDSLGLGICLRSDIQAALTENEQSGVWTGQQIAAFGVAAEEVSHFHYVAHHAPQGRGVSQLELEFQGEIDKFVLTYFASIHLAGTQDAAFENLMVKFFEHYSWDKVLTHEQRLRYEEANRLARGFLVKHAALLVKRELLDKFFRVAREFYRLSLEEKINRAMR